MINNDYRKEFKNIYLKYISEHHPGKIQELYNIIEQHGEEALMALVIQNRLNLKANWKFNTGNNSTNIIGTGLTGAVSYGNLQNMNLEIFEDTDYKFMFSHLGSKSAAPFATTSLFINFTPSIQPTYNQALPAIGYANCTGIAIQSIQAVAGNRFTGIDIIVNGNLTNLITISAASSYITFTEVNNNDLTCSIQAVGTAVYKYSDYMQLVPTQRQFNLGAVQNLVSGTLFSLYLT